MDNLLQPLDFESFNGSLCSEIENDLNFFKINCKLTNYDNSQQSKTIIPNFMLKIYIPDLPKEIIEENDFDDCFDADVLKACDPRDPFVLDNKISKAISLYEEVYKKRVIKENFDIFIQNFDKLLIEDSTELYMFSTMARIDFIRESIKFTIEYDIDDLLLSLAYSKNEKLYIKEVNFDSVENEIKKALR